MESVSSAAMEMPEIYVDSSSRGKSIKLDIVSPANIVFIPQTSNSKHNAKIIKTRKNGGNLKGLEPCAVRRPRLPGTRKTVSGEPSLDPFQLIFVTLSVRSPNWSTVLQDGSHQSKEKLLHSIRIIGSNRSLDEA